MSDHHDLAGFPNRFWILHTILGREFRIQIYMNIFNRLRNLEFSECRLIRKNIENNNNDDDSLFFNYDY